MATLPQKTFADFVDDMVTTWAVMMGVPAVFQSGDALLALMQGVAAQLIFIQAQIQLVNAIARAQTSTGADLDTFYGQFDFARLPGATAAGPVTLSKLIPAASQIIVPAGAIVQTPGGAIQYRLIADTTKAAWNGALNAYVMQVGASSIIAEAEALQAGSAFNVSAGQLSQLGTLVSGIDAVTNAAPISDGTEPEGDAAYSARFILYIQSLSKATYAAIVEAIESVQTGISFNVVENVDVAGHDRPGEFVAIIDDGTGAPPSGLLDRVEASLNAVRAFTVLAQTVAISVVSATISTTIRVAPGFNPSTVQLAVQAAIVKAVNATPIGGTLYVIGSEENPGVEAAAIAIPGVVSVRSGTTINGVAVDLTATAFQGIRTNSGLVTVLTY